MIWRPSMSTVPLHHVYDSFRRQPGILMDDKLAEDLRQRWEIHEGPQVFHGVVCYDVSLVKDDDPGANLLGHFEHVGRINNDLIFPGQLLDQVSDDEPCRNIQAGERLIEMQSEENGN